MMKTLYNIYEGLLDTDFSEEGVNNKSNTTKTEYINGILEQLFNIGYGMNYMNVCKYDDKNKIVHVTNPRVHINISPIHYLNHAVISGRLEEYDVDDEDVNLDDFLKTGIKIDGDFYILYDKNLLKDFDINQIAVGRNHTLSLNTWEQDIPKGILKKFLYNKQHVFKTIEFYACDESAIDDITNLTGYKNIVINPACYMNYYSKHLNKLKCENLIICNIKDTMFEGRDKDIQLDHFYQDTQIFESIDEYIDCIKTGKKYKEYDALSGKVTPEDIVKIYDYLCSSFKEIIKNNPGCKNLYINPDLYNLASPYPPIIDPYLNVYKASMHGEEVIIEKKQTVLV